jgi:HEAT repeat protein
MRLILILLLAVPAFAAENWIAWRIPTRSNVRVNGWNHCVSSGELVLAAQMRGDRIEEIRFFDPVCDPDFDGLKLQQQTKSGAESIDWLRSHLDTAGDRDEVVTAIALHEHEKVVPELIPLARNHSDSDVRRQAIFWLGQKAGTKVAGELRRAVDHDPDDRVKEHAVFAISQLPHERSVPILIELVKTHRNARVREKAMFWLAQTGDPRAIDLIESILTK